MAVTYSQQYRPLTDAANLSETDPDAQLSTRFFRDAARNANLQKGRAGPRQLIYTVFDNAANPFGLIGVAGGDNPWLYAQWWVPVVRGFSTIEWKFWGAHQVEASTVRVRSDVVQYRGPRQPTDTTRFSSSVQTSTVSVSSSTPNEAWYSSEVTIARRDDDTTFITLEIDNTAGSTTIFGVFGAWLKPLADVA